MPRRSALLSVVVLLSAVSTHAADKRNLAQVNWHTDVSQAWQQTQKNRRPLLIFVTHENCVYCTKMKTGTLIDGKVVAKIRGGFVPLVVDASHDCPLLKELNVKAYPATFVVSADAVVLDRIDGYVTPEALAKRLDKQNANSQLARTR
jgi:thiol:disulfide interchange protein